MRGEIHGQPHARGQALGVLAGLAQHQFAERHHQARFFGDGDEHAGEIMPRVGWRQRTSASQQQMRRFGEADDRLVMHFQLVAVDADAQVLFDLLAPLALFPPCRG